MYYYILRLVIVTTDEDPNTGNKNEVREVVNINMSRKIIGSMLYY